MKEASIPSEKARLSPFDPVQEEILSRGKSLLEEEPFDPDFSTDILARAFYKSCMNSKDREKVGVKPLQVSLIKYQLSRNPVTITDMILNFRIS